MLALFLQALAAAAKYEPEIAAFLGAIGHLVIGTPDGPRRIADILPDPGLSAQTAAELAPTTVKSP